MTTPDLTEAINAHSDYTLGEIPAVELSEVEPPEGLSLKMISSVVSG